MVKIACCYRLTLIGYRSIRVAPLAGSVMLALIHILQKEVRSLELAVVHSAPGWGVMDAAGEQPGMT